jgi:hypothetical protein
MGKVKHGELLTLRQLNAELKKKSVSNDGQIGFGRVPKRFISHARRLLKGKVE